MLTKNAGELCMAHQEYLNPLKQRVEVWNQWRQEQPDVIPDLSGTNPRRVRLIIADLSHADLSGTLQLHLLPQQ